MALTDEEKRQRKNARQREYAKRTGYAASRKSNKKNTKSFHLQFSYSTDGDIIEYLEGIDNKNGFIRDIIRASMSSTGDSRQV